MPTDFTRTIAGHARYWPTLYHCRADLLDHLFCTIGNGSNWKDGRLTDRGRRLTRREEEILFAAKQERLRQMHDDMERRFAEMDLKLPDGKPKRLKSFRPDRIRTDAQVEKVLRDRGHRRRMRSQQIRDAWAMERKMGFTLEEFWNDYSGSTVFYPLHEPYSAVFTVPDDVRPDWLAGIREVLEMIQRWDTPEQVEKAKLAQANLVARFGPVENWHKLKRRPPPPIVPPPTDVVGRKVRVLLPGERSWGEHRPDLGPNVYRSLNHTLSDVKLRLPEGHEGAGRNGKPCNLQWGHLFTGKEKPYGQVTPQYIIGRDLTPLPEGA